MRVFREIVMREYMLRVLITGRTFSLFFLLQLYERWTSVAHIGVIISQYS